MHMDGMDSIELRAKLGDRTYEAGVRLLEKDAIIERIELSGTAGYARVRDSGTKVVVYRDRNGVFDATCDCTVKPMGCKHCAADALVAHPCRTRSWTGRSGASAARSSGP